MDRIVSGEVLDIIPHAGGFLYADKRTMEDGSVRAAFFSYEQDKSEAFPITTKTYLSNKFGAEFKTIAEHLGDFISCDAAVMVNSGVIALYDTGEMHIFSSAGAPIWEGTLTYQDEPVRDLAADGKNVWCAVPDRNAVICYSPDEGRVLLRIGGGATSAFSYPVSITKYDDTLYVCNKNSYKVRTLTLENYSVKDYLVFKEPVLKYFRVHDHEYAVLESGIYIV
ncbi:MAG: hypothetical protein FWF05_04985 [Oscillospiraceae bacterium]|nr:hypothetical protein [Oscillospiraceae bacterium]